MTTETIDWDEFKMRCSCLGALFTEPQSKEAKERGDLSETAKKALIKTYAQVVWGRKKEIVTKCMEKGILVENDAIALLSMVEGVIYDKNEERGENEWVSGHPDIISDKIIDIKSSWEPETFIPKIVEPLSKDYFYQVQGYMWLFGKTEAQISYCLVNSPDSIVQNELKRLLFSMEVVTEEDPLYKKVAAELVRNHVFNDIPPAQRVISIKVARDESMIEKIPQKVTKAREFLASLHKKHLNF
jgi:hypothetical protein